MKKLFNFALIALPVVFLILIRMYEEWIFYDPFLHYFDQSFQINSVPDFNGLRLFLSHLFRYTLNTAISLVLLWLIFKNRQIVKLSVFIYLLLFVCLMPVYFLLIYYKLEDYLLFAFYTRRFLIQPLFIFILIPAFYYQRKFSK
jgi:exosortase F-associated protein